MSPADQTQQRLKRFAAATSPASATWSLPRRFISAWNQRCQPFVWTKDANTILGKLNRKRTAAPVRSASLSP